VLALAALAWAALAFAAAASWAAAPAPSSAGAAGGAVDEGRYLATAADCQSCHSTPGAVPYAGGGVLKSPFGDFYGPNITPDPETGIGRWTEADFESALRRGRGRGGELLYPAMPYVHYTRITDDDVHRLWLYFRSLPAVHNEAHTNTLRFPWNLRAGVSLWQAAFFQGGRWKPTPAKGEAWNRGSYLVEALGHCDECHTPRNLVQVSDERRRLTGARVEGWYAPDISSDALSRLQQFSVDELAHDLKTGNSAGNVKTFGPMEEVVHESLSRLTDADLHAMAVYLKDQPPPQTPQSAAVADLPADRLQAGRQLYEQHCSSCHGSDGRGLPRAAPALAHNGGATARGAGNVVSAVLQGFPAEGTWAAMPSFAGVLDDAEVADVANYVRRAWGNRGTLLASGDGVRELRGMADMHPGGQQPGVVCPALPAPQLGPAVRLGPQALRKSAQDPAALRQAVHAYRTARPRATAADVIEALSTAYCSSVVATGASSATAGARMADYAQKVAQVLVGPGGAR
jgi:mono/diheme cytochrome c family protein